MKKKKTLRYLAKLIESKIQKKLKNEDGYIELFFIIIVFFFLLSVVISVSPPFILREKLNIISTRVVERVEYDGKVTPDTHSFVNDLINRAKINDKVVTYAFNGNIKPNGKIQLRDEFTFSINAIEKIKISGFGDFTYDMNIQKEQTGLSEVFYKNSELQ